MKKYQLQSGKFVLMTMHRPSNVDTKEGLRVLTQMIATICESFKIVFPIHPRTVANLKNFGLMEGLSSIDKLIITEPIDYFSFQKLIAECHSVVTDSGGIQEETTYRKKPCLTLRNNTERPITTSMGTNQLVKYTLEDFTKAFNGIDTENSLDSEIPPFWDGKATERILEILDKVL
jgi:UDP-N-acetylglucosamine 2-epimerase (non-hydrolysing)